MRVSEKRHIVFIGFVLAIFVFLSFYFDGRIVRAVSSIQTETLNDVFHGIRFASSPIVILFFLTGIFLKKGRRKNLVPLWLTLFLSVAASFILKVFVQRQRPFQLGLVSVMEGLEKASHYVWNFSFPSSHALVVFAALPIISKEYPKFKYVWILFAALVAFSRIYFGVHFLSDVIVGGIIGYAIGALVLMYKEKG